MNATEEAGAIRPLFLASLFVTNQVDRAAPTHNPPAHPCKEAKPESEIGNWRGYCMTATWIDRGTLSERF